FANSKIVIGNKNKEGFELLDYRILKNSEGVYDFEGRLNVNEAVTQLSTAVNDLGAVRKKCYLTISSPKSIVRNRIFPFVNKKDLDAMVKIEAEQILPYDVDSFYIDYRVLGIEETAADKSLNVMVVAVPKELIDEAVDLVERCKMKLECVNVLVDSIYSFKEFCESSTEENVLVADIGYNYLRMIAFRDKAYFANINSENGVKSFGDFYKEQYGIPEEALYDYMFRGADLPSDVKKHLKEEDHQKDFASLSFSNGTFEINDEDEEIEDEFKLNYTPIIEEIHKMLGYYRSRKYGSQVDKILLCGGGASAKGLKEAIANDTSIQTAFMMCQHKENNMDTLLLTAAIGGILR
ncbi:MAG: pilus assembly protein PilM, partial [Clostridia bacterium]|nr:pilus assembly protein PilM [Clostridia bacterium]